MESEAQVKAMDDRVEPAQPPMLDLNRATVEELRSLDGIGRALARRIVAYREEQGGFRSPEELTAIPGIGRAAYEQLAGRLTVVPPEMAPPPPAGEAVVTEVPEVALVVPEPPEMEELPPPAAEEAEVEEEPGPAVEKAPTVKKAPAPPRAEPVVPLSQLPPQPAPSRRPFSFAWLWTALLGGLLGMIFTLLVFYGINGALDLSGSRAVLDVQNQMDSLSAEMDSLQGKIDGLGERLSTLEGLTARMERAESAVAALREEAVALDQRASTIEGELETISEDISEVQGQAQRVTTFFSQLQALLRDVFGDETAVDSTPESPVETPTPTQ